jgi:hypothetical protein
MFDFDTLIGRTIPLEIGRIWHKIESQTIADIAEALKRNEQKRLDLGLDTADTLNASTMMRLHQSELIRTTDTRYIERLARATGLTRRYIRDVIERSVRELHESAKADYLQIGKPFVPYEHNEYLQGLVRVVTAHTLGTLANITRTTALGITDKYGRYSSPVRYLTRQLDQATMSVISGTSYDSEIRRVIREVTQSGLRTVQPVGEPPTLPAPGRTVRAIKVVRYPKSAPRSLESVVRACVLTAVSQVCSMTVWNSIHEMGCKHILTSMHGGARESHQAWQGRVFAMNGTVAEILEKAEELRND